MTRADPILDRFLAGALPANVALMELLIEASCAGHAEAAIEDRLAEANDAGHRERLQSLLELSRRHPDAWVTVEGVMREADHERAPADWGQVFDRLVRVSPEGSVALYALGSPELLRDVTQDVVARLREWGLLGRDRRLLEIGCGIGRLTLALAPEMAEALGLDVSAEMVAEARRRGAGCPNASFAHTEGRDLAGVAPESVDLVLAADVFPYLVASDPALAFRHIEESARVLRPGGALLILNYSYRGDDGRDRADIRAAFARVGFRLERDGTRDFALWDGSAYLGRKETAAA